MDWDWIKAFPQTLKDQFKSMKITVNWEKAGPPYLLRSGRAAAAAYRRVNPLAFEVAEGLSGNISRRGGEPAQ